MGTFYVLFLVLFPIVGAFITYILGNKTKYREVIAIGVTLIEFIVMVICLFTYKNIDNTVEFTKLFGLGISFKFDGFRVLYSLISIFMWLMTVIFSKEYMHEYDNKSRFYMFYLLTLAGVVGVFLSNDLITTFLFFEFMSFASFFLVLHDEKKQAINGAISYLGVAVISGMILLMGLFMLNNRVGDLSFESIKAFYLVNSISSIDMVTGLLIMFGFGAKAGMFPLHTWLPKAYPVAPSNASALLSGIIKKTGVFGIVVIASNMFLGNKDFGLILLTFSSITMVLGAILALFSTNLKRTLACSSMSQVSFALVGLSMAVLLGEHNTLAASGSLMHLVNHSLIKLVLFSIAGVVVMNLEELDLNKIRGFGRNKYAIMIAFGIACLGIMGIPFFNGFVSKTLMHHGIVEVIEDAAHLGVNATIMTIIEWTFLATGGITIAYMTKLFVCLFIEKNKDEELQKKYDEKKNYLTLTSKIVIVGSSVILFILGSFIDLITIPMIDSANGFFGVHESLKDVLHHHHEKIINLNNVLDAGISVLIGAFVYFVINRLLLMKDGNYINRLSPKLDLEDKVYRPLLNGIYLVLLYISFVFAYLLDSIILFVRKTILKSNNYEFNDHSLAYNIGKIIDKRKKNAIPEYAEKAEDLVREITISKNIITTNFSFALMMISLGLVLVLIAVLFL